MALVIEKKTVRNTKPRVWPFLALGAALLHKSLTEGPPRATGIPTGKTPGASEPAYIPKGVPPPPSSPVISPSKSPTEGRTVRMSEARGVTPPPLITPYGEDWTRRIKYTDLEGNRTKRFINENAPGARVFTASTGNTLHCAWCLLRGNYRSFREQAIVTIKEP